MVYEGVGDTVKSGGELHLSFIQFINLHKDKVEISHFSTFPPIVHF